MQNLEETSLFNSGQNVLTFWTNNYIKNVLFDFASNISKPRTTDTRDVISF